MLIFWKTVKQDDRVSFNNIEVTDEKKFQIPRHWNMLIFVNTNDSRNNMFKKDILFNYFGP